LGWKNGIDGRTSDAGDGGQKRPTAGQACRLITDPDVTGVVVLEAGVVEELPAPEWWW